MDGLDPGIDHMSAMRNCSTGLGLPAVQSHLLSHCGGLVAPESDDNPGTIKSSWNHNIILTGKAGAVYKENNKVVHLPLEQLFNAKKLGECRAIHFTLLS